MNILFSHRRKYIAGVQKCVRAAKDVPLRYSKLKPQHKLLTFDDL
jgi:hypothetical protein